MDWKRKLTSRKFWAAVAEFVTMLVIAFGAAKETAVQVSALIMAGATVIAYIVGEGLVDAAGANSPTIVLPEVADLQEEKPPANQTADTEH